jgi:hypothetical protein
MNHDWGTTAEGAAVSTWSERHHVDVDEESEVDPEDLFDERKTGWSRYEDPDDVELLDDDDEGRDREDR